MRRLVASLERAADCDDGVVERAAGTRRPRPRGIAPDRRPALSVTRAVAIDADGAGLELGHAREHRLRRHRCSRTVNVCARPTASKPRGIAGSAAKIAFTSLAKIQPAACAQRKSGRTPNGSRARTSVRVGRSQRAIAHWPLKRRKRLGAPRLVGVDDDLGVAAGAEAVAERLELGAQLDVVEDLAVEDDPQRAVLVGQRLLAGRQVDDGQAGVRQAGALVAIGPELVRPAVPERACTSAPAARRSGSSAFSCRATTPAMPHISGRPSKRPRRATRRRRAGEEGRGCPVLGAGEPAEQSASWWSRTHPGPVRRPDWVAR